MIKARDDLLIGVVGNCVSGKTTLVKGLVRKGYRAVNIAQEHSEVKSLWRRKHPVFLICLSCTLATARKRREICWGQERLDDQWRRLSQAREQADLYLPTDNLTIERVLDTAIKAVGKEEHQEKKM